MRRNHRIYLLVTKDEKERIRQKAKMEGKSISELIRGFFDMRIEFIKH